MKMTRSQSKNLPGASPWSQLARLRDQLDDLFEPLGFGLGFGLPEGWAPQLDLYEDKNKITVKAELPGMKKEDIQISIQNHMLTITGERKHEQEDESAEAYRSERYFGKFQRSIDLPQPVKEEDVSATYKDGVLCVYLPKTEEAKPKQIKVQD